MPKSSPEKLAYAAAYQKRRQALLREVRESFELEYHLWKFYNPDGTKKKVVEGSPCRKNPQHRNLRRVDDGHCVDCEKDRQKTPRYLDLHRVHCRRHIAKDPEKHRARRREWKKNNRHVINARKYARRHATRLTDASATDAEIDYLLLLQLGCCAYCGEPAAHLDHKVPLILKGQHTIKNLQWLCAFHNISKGARTDTDYRFWYGIPLRTPWDAC